MVKRPIILSLVVVLGGIASAPIVLPCMVQVILFEEVGGTCVNGLYCLKGHVVWYSVAETLHRYAGGTVLM